MNRVLVVEDDKFLRHAYEAKLKKEGLEVNTAADGDEAIKTMDWFRADLILLDLVMPKKDGFVVLEELRKNKNWKHIPVIITTNLGLQEDIDRAADLGYRDYIIKADMRLEDVVRKVKVKLNMY